MDGKYGRLFTEADAKALMVRYARWVVTQTERQLAEGKTADEQAFVDMIDELMASDELAFPADEPLFLLRGQDPAVLGALGGYADALEGIGAPSDHIQLALHAAGQIVAWQSSHLEGVKVPD